MKTYLLIASVIAAGLALLALVLGVSVMNDYNCASSLKIQYEAKVIANQSTFDNMTKKIGQSVQVTDAQKNALKEIFNGYAAARTGNGGGGEIMKWVQESCPTVDTKVYQNLQNIITASRDEWTRNQVELVDIAREYNQLLAVFPSNVVLRAFGFQTIIPKIVTSSRTGKAFETGKDDDIKLDFGK